MAIPESATTLKSFFENGDRPTEQEFADLIDTFFHLFQQAIDAADAAAIVAQEAKDLAPSVVYRQGGSTNNRNVSSVGTPSTGTRRINFAVPFVATDYVMSVLSGNTAVQSIVATTRAVDHVIIRFANDANAEVTPSDFDVVIFGTLA